MDDLISRKAAIKAVERKTYRHTYLDQIIDILNDLPSARPERGKGEWLRQESDYTWADICSECGKAYVGVNYSMSEKPPINYCPNCGVDISGKYDG